MSAAFSDGGEFLDNFGIGLADNLVKNHVRGYYDYINSDTSLPLQYELGIDSILATQGGDRKIYSLLSYISQSFGVAAFWIDPASKFLVSGLSEVVRWPCSYESKKKVFSLLDTVSEICGLIEQNSTLYPLTVVEQRDFTVLSAEIEKVYLNSAAKRYVVGLVGAKSANYDLVGAVLEYLRTSFQTRMFPV